MKTSVRYVNSEELGDAVFFCPNCRRPLRFGIKAKIKAANGINLACSACKDQKRDITRGQVKVFILSDEKEEAKDVGKDEIPIHAPDV